MADLPDLLARTVAIFIFALGIGMVAVHTALAALVDLIVAPAAAYLSGAQVIGLYPLSLVPLFIGPPLGILAHVYSLRNLALLSSSSVTDPAHRLPAGRRHHTSAMEGAFRRT